MTAGNLKFFSFFIKTMNIPHPSIAYFFASSTLYRAEIMTSAQKKTLPYILIYGCIGVYFYIESRKINVNDFQAYLQSNEDILFQPNFCKTYFDINFTI